ncbi:MAG TPA: glycosyltransferase [Polyangiaceae bacterium]|nr:glycosyltransferase [Polyangiaceae bacterium]
MVQVAVALTLTSFALYAAMMGFFTWAAYRRRRGLPVAAETGPRVTIFKPLAGCDDDLEDNLESFARLEYPSFEVLLGIARRNDPALEVACRFLARHPALDARVVFTDPHAAVNPKVAQLIGLEREATGEVYVISDSNVRVRPTYLWSMVNELADGKAGIVTSLFSGTGEQSLGAALENLQICASTAPGIASMDVATGRAFTVGKSLAVRRRDLQRLGGFAPVGGVLAEDHLLGRRFQEAGFETRLSMEVVENRNVRCSIARTFERHTRWAKMRRSLFPIAFCVEPVLTPIGVASVALLLSPTRVMLALFACVTLAQMAWASLAVRLLRGRFVWWYAPLEIVRSYVALGCWGCACLSRRISWRGHLFWLLRGTAIVPVDPPSDQPPSRERLPA